MDVQPDAYPTDMNGGNIIGDLLRKMKGKRPSDKYLVKEEKPNDAKPGFFDRILGKSSAPSSAAPSSLAQSSAAPSSLAQSDETGQPLDRDDIETSVEYRPDTIRLLSKDVTVPAMEFSFSGVNDAAIHDMVQSMLNTHNEYTKAEVRFGNQRCGTDMYIGEGTKYRTLFRDRYGFDISKPGVPIHDYPEESTSAVEYALCPFRNINARGDKCTLWNELNLVLNTPAFAMRLDEIEIKLRENQNTEEAIVSFVMNIRSVPPGENMADTGVKLMDDECVKLNGDSKDPLRALYQTMGLGVLIIENKEDMAMRYKTWIAHKKYNPQVVRVLLNASDASDVRELWERMGYVLVAGLLLDMDPLDGITDTMVGITCGASCEESPLASDNQPRLMFLLRGYRSPESSIMPVAPIEIDWLAETTVPGTDGKSYGVSTIDLVFMLEEELTSPSGATPAQPPDLSDEEVAEFMGILDEFHRPDEKVWLPTPPIIAPDADGRAWFRRGPRVNSDDSEDPDDSEDSPGIDSDAFETNPDEERDALIQSQIGPESVDYDDSSPGIVSEAALESEPVEDDSGETSANQSIVTQEDLERRAEKIRDRRARLREGDGVQLEARRPEQKRNPDDTSDDEPDNSDIPVIYDPYNSQQPTDTPVVSNNQLRSATTNPVPINVGSRYPADPADTVNRSRDSDSGYESGAVAPGPPEIPPRFAPLPVGASTWIPEPGEDRGSESDSDSDSGPEDVPDEPQADPDGVSGFGSGSEHGSGMSRARQEHLIYMRGVNVPPRPMRPVTTSGKYDFARPFVPDSMPQRPAPPSGFVDSDSDSDSDSNGVQTFVDSGSEDDRYPLKIGNSSSTQRPILNNDDMALENFSDDDDKRGGGGWGGSMLTAFSLLLVTAASAVTSGLIGRR